MFIDLFFSLFLLSREQQEKFVLENVAHPLILPFVKTFKDQNNVYFLTEFVKGMELFDVIREMNLLTDSDCQFYIGSMILAIEYLHHKNIIYRDLKPENVMVDHNGNVMLIDMGTAKPLEAKNSIFRTFTILGTPHYMAPEVFSGKGYHFKADLWSIGVCLYEFMCGMVPFGEECEDPYDIYQTIIKSKLDFPNYVTSTVGKEFMNVLLEKNPDTRGGRSYAVLKAHRFFDKFNWVVSLFLSRKSHHSAHSNPNRKNSTTDN